MESATLTRSGAATGWAARLRAVPATGWAAAGLALVTVAALVGYLVYPTFPNYDSYYSLLWAREALHLEPLSFDGYRTPTEHPLAILFGVPLVLLGDGGDRVLVFFTVASFVALVAGMYRLGRLSFGPLVGAVGALLLCTRFDFPFLAVRGYIDIPYLALVVWAAALEVARPRRGLPVFLLLTAAALLRPEAWILIGVYWLWFAWRAPWRGRIGFGGGGPGRAGGRGVPRLAGDRRPAVLAASHGRHGRGARPRQRPGRGADLDAGVSRPARQAARCPWRHRGSRAG